MRLWYFSSSVTYSSNVHAQPSSGARCLTFGRILQLLPYFMCATAKALARLRRLTSAFAGRLCDKYHNLMSWLIYHYSNLIIVKTVAKPKRNVHMTIQYKEETNRIHHWCSVGTDKSQPEGQPCP